MIEFRVSMEAPSTPNLREHWGPKASRTKRQRGAIARKMPKWPGGPLLLVRLTRIAPRALDGDNMQGAMKAIRDQVAAGLRVDDRAPLVEWQYHQEKGEAEVVVQIWNPNLGPPPLPPLGRPVEHKPRNGGTRPGQKTPRGKAVAAHAEAERMKGGPLRVRCAKNGCRRLLPCPDHSHHIMANYTPPRGSRTNPMSTKAFEPSNAAEHRALHAALEAEATFAPAPACNWGHSDCCLVHSGERP